jgi:glycosyltransferase involved in cell wall biosynthesis
MPTKNRREFVAQALYYFEKQDYPNKELIVVDDGDDLVVDLVSQHAHVRYLAPQYAHTVGMKRNIACEAAQGELICHWDDDDWYASTRLSYQVAPFLTGEVDITGLHFQSVLDIQHMRGWRCADIVSPTAGVDGMHYGTAIYRKQLWMNRARFQDSVEGDDGSGFVRKLINSGAIVFTLPCADQQVYVRHGRNIWKYRPGTSIGSEIWTQVSLEQCIPQEDLNFYRNKSIQMAKKANVDPTMAAMKRRANRILTKRIAPFVFSFRR